MKRRGFTVVELLVIIIVIGLLASIVLVSYNSTQRQARDAQIRDAASKIAESIELLSIKQGLTPTTSRSGSGSSGSITVVNGVSQCANGSGNGWFGKGSYTCTMEDVLVANGYIESTYISSLPGNTRYSGNPTRYSFMIYRCNASGATGDFALLYTLEQPDPSDTTGYDSVYDDCQPGPTKSTFAGYGMRGAKYIDLQ